MEAGVRWLVAGAVALLACYGCATTKGDGEAPLEAAPPARVQKPGVFPKVTLELSQGTLGDTVRIVGENVGGGIVVVNGLEASFVPDLALRNAPYTELIAQMSLAPQILVAPMPYYYLMHSEGMEVLLDWHLEEQLAAPWDAQAAALAFGADSSLFNALAVLSQSLGLTLVADQIVGVQGTGELTLDVTPLPIALNALLQSARLMPTSVQLEQTPEYLFFYASENPVPGDLVLNRDSLSAGAKALLAQKIDAVVPETPPASDVVTVDFETRPLRHALAHFARQTQVPVRCAPTMADLPVTLTVFRGVSVETALSLLIRQWPVGGFGIYADDSGIELRPRAVTP